MQNIKKDPKTLKNKTTKTDLTVDLILAVQQLSDAAAGPLNLVCIWLTNFISA